MKTCDYCGRKLSYMNGYFACDHCQSYKQSANADLSRQQVFSELLEQNQNLIYKKAWQYARKYNMDFNDIKSQAFLIFCEALDRFDGRASFTTFLFYRLMTLNDYCKKEKNLLNHPQVEPGPGKGYGGYDYNSNNDDDRVPDWMTVEDKTEERLAFYQVVESLSRDGQDVVQHLIFGSFNEPKDKWARDAGKYRIQEILTKDWGWNKDRAENVWHEIQGWWTENFESNSIIETRTIQ